MSPRAETTPAETKPADATSARQRWMGVLARAERAELEAAWSALADKPAYRLLRRPETGLVMARGRIGGAGGAFNLGEIAVTRCVAQLTDGQTGYSYVAGRDARKSELAAVFDGLLQDDGQREWLLAKVVTPLAAAQDERLAHQRAQAASTKVNFLALERGEDER